MTLNSISPKAPSEIKWLEVRCIDIMRNKEKNEEDNEDYSPSQDTFCFSFRLYFDKQRIIRLVRFLFLLLNEYCWELFYLILFLWFEEVIFPLLCNSLLIYEFRHGLFTIMIRYNRLSVWRSPNFLHLYLLRVFKKRLLGLVCH